MRGVSGNVQLDVDQIRAAFLVAAGESDRLATFVRERLLKLRANDGPAKLPNVPKTVLHVIPAGALEGQVRLHLRDLEDPENRIHIPVLGQTGYDGRRFNFDGFFTFSYDDEQRTHAYTQIFNSGIVESVESMTVHPRYPNEGNKIYAIPLRKGLIGVLRSSFAILSERFNVRGPFNVALSFIGVENFEVISTRYHSPRATIDRDLLTIDVSIEDSLRPENLDAVVRPLFDALWQAAGSAHCTNFDAGGKWSE